MDPDLRQALCDVLDTLFNDNTDAERMKLWAIKVGQSRWTHYAADTLRLLDAVLADPPADLPALLEAHGGIVPPDHQTAAEWLRQATTELRAAYDAGRG
jgi:hypothetical protein